MKNIFYLITLLLSINLASAQDAAFKADVLKMITTSGANAQMEIAKKQILAMVPEDKKAGFLVEFDATMPSLYDKLADIYMKEYTHQDVKGMLAFYETPLGKKMSSKAGPIFEQTMAAAQEWGQILQGVMMKYMK